MVSDEELIALSEGFDCMVFKHPARSTINEEIELCRELNFDIDENLNYHRDKEGILSMCGIIVRKNTDEVKRLNEKWWAEICRGSVRDQLSFPYTLGLISKQIETEFFPPYDTKFFKYNFHKCSQLKDISKNIEN